MTLVELAEKYHVRRETISKHVRNGNIQAMRLSNRHYDVNEESFLYWYNNLYHKEKASPTKRNWNRHIFDIIDTPEKAYWLGMLTSDGCVKNNGYSFSLDLGGRDKEHILKFLHFLGGTDDMLQITIHPDTKNELAHAQLCSKDCCERLMELGITPHKSGHEKFIYTNFNADFIRGLIDGDGYIRQDLTEIGLVGSYELLDAVQQIFLTEINVQPNAIMEHGCIYKISYRAKTAIYKIAQYLYSNPVVSLSRKQELADKILTEKIC